MQKNNILSLALNLLIKFVAVGFGLFTNRWLISSLSIGEYETYVLIIAYNQLILQLVDFGIPLLIQKYYTNETDIEKLSTVWSTFNLFRFFSYFISIILVLFTFRFSQTDNLNLIILIYSAQFIILADNNYRSVCNTNNRTWQFSASDVFGKLILIIGLFLVYQFYVEVSPIWFFGYASLASYVFSYLIDFYWQNKYVKWGKPDLSIINENKTAIASLSLSTLAVASYLNTDRLILKFFEASAFEVNSYANGYKILDLASIVTGLLVPQIASQLIKALKGKNNKKPVLKYSFGVVSLSFFVSLAILVIGPYVLSFIDIENKYSLAWDILPLLALVQIPMMISFFMGHIVVFLNGEKFVLLVTILISILVNSSYFILIPQYGVWGAAWSTLIGFITEVIIWSFVIYYLAKKSKSILQAS